MKSFVSRGPAFAAAEAALADSVPAVGHVSDANDADAEPASS